ncbi:MAG: hypothetical protein H7A19_15030 [Rhodanobacteraceae bacterium]|nr:hypothetical protein [Rhodanobacteraceae bacterium]
MVTPVIEGGMVSMPIHEFQEMLEHAVELGARRGLADVGLEGDDAARDIRALRGLLDAHNAAEHTTWQTVIKILTTALVIALATSAAIHFKLFGGR